MIHKENKMDNMKLWDRVSITDPSITKKLEFGKGFKPTTIDAYRQIECFTREFGPATQGWHFKTEMIMGHPKVCSIKLSLFTNDNNKCIEVFGTAEWEPTSKTFPNGKLDPEAPKKATTDALTKAFSILGFNADVFMGKFDDNKYVSQAKAYHDQQKQSRPETNPQREAMIQKIQMLESKLEKSDAISHKPKSEDELRAMNDNDIIAFGVKIGETVKELGL